MQIQVTICQYEGIDSQASLPLAAGVLIAAARQDQTLCQSLSFGLEVERRTPHDAAAALEGSDIVGFSLYPWNAEYSLAVIRMLGKLYPEKKILVGGPSVPKRKEGIDSFMESAPEIDISVLGEAEESFPQLLRSLLGLKPLKEVPSISYRTEGGALLHTTAPMRVKDFLQSASPYLDGTFSELVERYPGRFTTAVIETNRGCPFSCTFCDWSITKQVIEYPIGRIKKEIDWAAETGFGSICIVDANFGIRPRDPEIAAHMAETKHRTGKPGFCYFYLTKNSHRKNLHTIEVFQAAGISCCVGLAVQDFDDKVLATVKRDNIQSMETNQLRRICAERGIPSRNELILGLPGQSYSSFADTVIKAMPPFPHHDFVIFLCRLLWNTEMGGAAHRNAHQLQTRRCIWRPRQGQRQVVDEYQELVVGTKDLPPEDWRRINRFCAIAGAGYNQNLLRTVFRGVRDLFGVGLRQLIECLDRSISEAERGTVLFDIGQTMERYLQSIMDSGPYALAADGLGDTNWELDEAVAICILRSPTRFYGELLSLLRDLLPDADERLEELVDFQRHLIPVHGMKESSLRYKNDWLGFENSIEEDVELVEAETDLRFVPPAYSAIPCFPDYIGAYFGLMRAKSISTFRLHGIRVETERRSQQSA
jgi:radical SAM superfamily enzyme YgiQ (UPF0313 family)